MLAPCTHTNTDSYLLLDCVIDFFFLSRLSLAHVSHVLSALSLAGKQHTVYLDYLPILFNPPAPPLTCGWFGPVLYALQPVPDGARHYGPVGGVVVELPAGHLGQDQRGEGGQGAQVRPQHGHPGGGTAPGARERRNEGLVDEALKGYFTDLH